MHEATSIYGDHAEYRQLLTPGTAVHEATGVQLVQVVEHWVVALGVQLLVLMGVVQPVRHCEAVV